MAGERPGGRAAIEEWLILGIFGTLTAVFAWYTKDGQGYDLVFILPLVIFIAILCVIVAVGVATRGADARRSGAETDRPPQGQRPLAFLMLLLLIGLSTVGFFTSLFIFLIAAMWLLGVRRWTTLVVVPVALMATIYVVFVQVLDVPVAKSPIGLY